MCPAVHSINTSNQVADSVLISLLLPLLSCCLCHRIDTIMDCDQLLVLSNGALVESGAPGQLAARTGGMFAGMVEAAKAAAATAPGDKPQQPQL